MFAPLNSLSLPTTRLVLKAWAVATAKASASDMECLDFTALASHYKPFAFRNLLMSCIKQKSPEVGDFGKKQQIHQIFCE
jgi:hypothetical protein